MLTPSFFYCLLQNSPIGLYPSVFSWLRASLEVCNCMCWNHSSCESLWISSIVSKQELFPCLVLTLEMKYLLLQFSIQCILLHKVPFGRRILVLVQIVQQCHSCPYCWARYSAQTLCYFQISTNIIDCSSTICNKNQYILCLSILFAHHNLQTFIHSSSVYAIKIIATY